MITFATEQSELPGFIRIGRSNGAEQRSWGLPKTADNYVNGLRTTRLPIGDENKSVPSGSESSVEFIHNPPRYLCGVRS